MKAPARRGPKPGPPAYHRSRRLIVERLAQGSATLAELADASGARGSTLAHHVGVLKMTGEICRVWGSRPTRLCLTEATR